MGLREKIKEVVLLAQWDGKASDDDSSGKRWTFYVIIFVLYLVLYRYSNIFHTTDIRSTPWNPEAGIAVAAGGIMGFRSVPVILLANITGNLIWNPGLGVTWSAVSAVAHTAIFAGSASLYSVQLRKLAVPSLPDILRFCVFAVLLTFVSAIARLVLAVLVLNISATYFWFYAFAISVGSLIGIVTIVPLAILAASQDALFRIAKRLNAVDVALMVSIGPVAYVVFGLKETDEFKFFYMVFIPVIALAVRQGVTGAAIGLVLSDFAMIGILALRQYEPSTAAELQLLMLSLSFTGLILGAVVNERESALEQLALSHEQLQESQSALLKASRLSLASELASSMAHEFNQPLSAVRSFVRSVRRQLDRSRPSKTRLASNIDEAVDQIDHLARLLGETRRFLGKGVDQLEIVAVRPLIEGCLSMSAQELKRARIAVVFQFSSDLPPVRGVRTQLQQVILNLIRNAKEAIVEGRATRREILIEASGLTRPGFVEVSISDTGPGVPVTLKGDLFRPVRSEKADGLGLGLSLNKSILLNHGGDIWHEELHPNGSKFNFIVPVE